METPCIKICTYEPAIGMCIGCGRTLAEVRGWFEMTDAERRAVMDVAARNGSLRRASQLSSRASATFWPITMMARAGALAPPPPARPAW